MAPIWSQTLRLEGGSAAPGGVATVKLSLESPKGKDPVALQWEIAYPSPRVGTEDSDLTVGSTAKSSGKSLTCAGKPANAGVYVYRCILAGGVQPIGNGPIAEFRFHVRTTTPPGPVTIRVNNAIGVTADLKKVDLAPAQADVNVP